MLNLLDLRFPLLIFQFGFKSTLNNCKITDVELSNIWAL